MGRIIGTILGAILAIWLAVTAAGGIFATLKTFLIIGLIAMADTGAARPANLEDAPDLPAESVW